MCTGSAHELYCLVTNKTLKNALTGLSTKDKTLDRTSQLIFILHTNFSFNYNIIFKIRYLIKMFANLQSIMWGGG